MRQKLLLGTFVLAQSISISSAGVRHFTFLYEANTSAPGSLELENWVTWQRTTGSGRFDQVDFRHELEYGVSEKLQLSLYLADWFYENDREHSGSAYSDSAIELIYNLTNPVIDPVGLSIYGELRAGDRLIELESKLIAQKSLEQLILAYNATLESVSEGKDLTEREGEFSQACGASYEISPRLSLGVELLHEFVFPEWRDNEKIRNLFVGPNVLFRHRNWFVTVTSLAQASIPKMSPTFSYGQFSESPFEMRVTFLHQGILEGDVSARPRVAPASRRRTILILTIAIVCLAPLSSCVTTFAPPPVTAELMQAGTNAEVATLRQGRTLFVHRCIESHTLPPFWHYRAEDWPHIIDTMSHRANLRPADRDAIVANILAVRAQ